MKTANKQPSGYTLVEVIFYVSITVVMITIYASFVTDLLKTTDRIASTSQVESISRFVVGRITQEIKTADALVSVSPSELVLIDANGRQIRFYLNAAEKTVYLDDGTSDQRLSNEKIQVNSLSFSQASQGVNIRMNVQSVPKKTGGSFKFDLSSFAVPRQLIY